MPSPWTVAPEETKIDLVWKDGETDREFWIKVKKRLSIGESRSTMKSISRVRSVLQGQGKEAERPEAQFDWTEYSFARAITYLLDWSFADDNGNKIPLKRSTIESLHPALFDVIDEAINSHDVSLSNNESKKTKSSGQARKTT